MYSSSTCTPSSAEHVTGLDDVLTITVNDEVRSTVFILFDAQMLYSLVWMPCRSTISCKNDWNLFFQWKIKNTWLCSGLELLTFQLLLQHLRYFYHPDPHWNTFGFSGPAVYLKEVFIHGIQFFAISKHCVIDVGCIFVVMCPYLCFGCLSCCVFQKVAKSIDFTSKKKMKIHVFVVWRHMHVHTQLMCWNFKIFVLTS